MNHPTPLPRYNLHDMVVAGIRDLITSGELRPGDKIPEQHLCERFGVSRTPLREALKVLAAEGMLQLQPRRGAVVARVSAEEIDELFPIMGALEALAGEIICRHLTDDNYARLQALHDSMMKAFDAGDEAAYLKDNRGFHELLVDLAGNVTLKAFYAQILARTRAFRFVARKSAENWRIAIEEHGLIMQALAKRDGPRLSRLLRRHVNGLTMKIARESLQEVSASKPRPVPGKRKRALAP